MPYSRQLVDEIPGVNIDRSRSVRASASTLHAGSHDLKLEITVQLQCEVDLAPDRRTPVSVRVVGLRLDIVEHNGFTAPRGDVLDPEWDFVPSLIQLFNANLPLFPHLRVAELHANLRLLQHAVKIEPGVSRLPTMGGRLQYQWGCPRRSFRELPRELVQFQCIGVDPNTLEFSGTLIVVITGAPSLRLFLIHRTQLGL